MKLSVIIVSYNVSRYLEECLYSVINAASGIETEIFVVDNNSADNSAEMVARLFPDVRLIVNNDNPGFSKANNQALVHAGGEYILFLNPDTLVRDETFRVCIGFMDSHPDAGAMGVKMINGKGRYLPESKRAVPTPLTAFYKISGLTSLFPHSKRFGRYYLGHMDEDETHLIEVLTGAFFFTRKEVLDQAGWFDESYFMYGEDIDLSCRILNNNYTIWYHPGTSIIHYKGESTRKSSINYVLTFYRAMIIYTKKYFSPPGASLLLFFLHTAIYFRAALSIARRVLLACLLPAADAALISAGYLFLPGITENILYRWGMEIPARQHSILIPALVIIWLVSIGLVGGYRRSAGITGALRGFMLGTLGILLVYAMLSPDWYQKALIILPLAVWGGVAIVLTRLAASFFHRFRG